VSTSFKTQLSMAERRTQILGGVAMDSGLDLFSSHDEITSPTHESDALRLRRALQRLRINLEDADSEVMEMLEEWQEEAKACEEKEQLAAKHQARADELDAEVYEHRQQAAKLFQDVAAKLASTALTVHVQTAPFVHIEKQQALQLQCWVRHGKRWLPVRLMVGDGHLTYTRVSRSFWTLREIVQQHSIGLKCIDMTRAEGEVHINTGLCSVEARWQWACLLSAEGRQQFQSDKLVFGAETEEAMHFWAREVAVARMYLDYYGDAVRSPGGRVLLPHFLPAQSRPDANAYAVSGAYTAAATTPLPAMTPSRPRPTGRDKPPRATRPTALPPPEPPVPSSVLPPPDADARVAVDPGQAGESLSRLAPSDQSLTPLSALARADSPALMTRYLNGAGTGVSVADVGLRPLSDLGAAPIGAPETRLGSSTRRPPPPPPPRSAPRPPAAASCAHASANSAALQKRSSGPPTRPTTGGGARLQPATPDWRSHSASRTPDVRPLSFVSPRAPTSREENMVFNM